MSNWSYDKLAEALRPNPNTYYEALNDIKMADGSSLNLTDEQKMKLANTVANMVNRTIDNNILNKTPVLSLTIGPLLNTLKDVHANDESLGQAALSSGVGSVVGVGVYYYSLPLLETALSLEALAASVLSGC